MSATFGASYTSPAESRLLAAVPLLRTRSVTEVSGRLGYASPAAFTAAFTRTFGTPPSRFATRPGAGEGGRVPGL
ncbi:AraC family transcriptional regulator [Streptomyces gougerotii]|nr:AraC family transcriptional regulator [Streptomyces sp. TSRI0384-2]WSU38890.1 AraC family transcriptional regulator [Streptomyces gougerotii]